MRTKKSLINILVSCMAYLLTMVGSFVTRGVFSRVLGLDTVGIDGVFLNMASMLGIVEMGLGVSIVYKLYRPIADGDMEAVAVILKFLRKAYRVIVLVVMIIGAVLSLFAGFLVNEGEYSKPWLSAIFLLYVLDVLSSYLFAYKRAMFIADQRNYVNNLCRMACQTIAYGMEIVVLLQFGSFVGYLLVKIAFRVMECLAISRFYDKNYRSIQLDTQKEMDPTERRDLFTNLRALLLHKVASFTLYSSANIITVFFQGLTVGGIYSNYMMIVTGLTSLSNEVFNGIIASFGNLMNSTEDSERVYDNYQALYFINYLIYSFFTASFICVLEPFTKVWIGENATFPIATTVLISVYLYMTGMRQSVLMVKSSAGIYRPDRYFAVLEAVLNIGLAMILVNFIGVFGIVLGNILSLFLVPFWTQPCIVYHTVFRRSAKSYYFKYIFYAVMTAAISGLTYWACTFIPAGPLQLVLTLAVCLILPNGINLLCFARTKEFRMLFQMAREMLSRIKNILAAQ